MVAAAAVSVEAAVAVAVVLVASATKVLLQKLLVRFLSQINIEVSAIH